jgi:hypothetical protein
MSQQSTDSRRAWRIRGTLQDYQIVRCFDLLADEAQKRVPSVFIEADLDSWLSSLFTKRIVHELYEVVSGSHFIGPPLHPREENTERIKHRVTEAFRSGELVALPLGPLRFQRKQGQAPASNSSPPLVVPLLADKPEKAPQGVAKQEKVPQSFVKQEERTWVAFKLVGADSKPVAGARYRLTLPDGSTREGNLDAQGAARVDGIAPGQCRVAFPDLDATG